MFSKLFQLFMLFIITPFLGKAEDGEIPQSIYQIHAESINGHTVSFSAFRGNVLLIVNVASRCGFTGQYKELQELYNKYQEKGFFVLAFPSNDFFHQEPGTNQEIAGFCDKHYQITFPLFEKIYTTGPNKHPLYRFLTSKKTNPHYNGEVNWNFNKFLIDRNGNIINRFSSMTPPDAPQVIEAIEKALGPTK